ncbi:MAG: hypothetical protein JXA78_01580 [Anaerolineales bacterium]|nr:hypothetical protein [Anaerolineales bacterium]
MENERVKEHSIPVSLVLDLEAIQPSTQEHTQAVRLRAGDLCPTCGAERLEYDGMLNLACPKCGYALSGCFT